MATNSATLFSGPMDPKDNVDFIAGFSDLLDTGETVSAGFTVVPSAAATALGFSISTSPAPALANSNKSILFFTEVAGGNQEDEVFSINGVIVDIEINITTSGSRTFQRTFQITIKQL